MSKKSIHLSLILGCLILLSYLLWMNFSPTGEQTIVYDFKTKSPFTAGLWPATRLQSIECGADGCSQKIYNDPVYLNLLLPRRFEKVEVILRHKKHPYAMSWGVKVGDDWQYFQEKFELPEDNGEWAQSRVSLDLRSARIKNREVEFVLSIPEIKNSSRSVEIKEIVFNLSRETWLKKIKDAAGKIYD